ncbi:hypothetical protein L1049_027756 [Liquidambar formosana]|uniref:Alcohol-forming fatty acyl-CoA reductase n=1 Tax=Liquidambar formosana TaxID=63359 RepID=A0AAP0RJQ5_LIQFO
MDVVFVEKILRTQPNVNKIFLLVRAADTKAATERFHNEVLGKELFRVVREKWGSNLNSLISEKVLAIPGDISCDNLGVKDPNLREEMWREIDVILNSAATTKFDERARLYGWPNTYVFTKAMGEMLLGHLRENLPLVIIRPTIITTTYKEPFPGWIEGFRTIDSIVISYAKGKLSCFLGNVKSILDAIPADMVVNLIFEAMVVHASQSSEIIYHVGSSMRNPLKLLEIRDYSFRYFTKNPWIKEDGKPVKVGKVTMLSNMASFHRYMAIHCLLPLKGLQVIDTCCCYYFHSKYIKLNRKINFLMRAVELYRPFVFFEGIFDDTNAEKLRTTAKERNVEIEASYFDPKCIDWEDYFMNTHIPGLIKYKMDSIRYTIRTSLQCLNDHYNEVSKKINAEREGIGKDEEKRMADQQKKPEILELNNGTMQVKITNYGATITSLSVPDKNGKLADVVLGFDSLEPYLKGAAPYFGAIVGRVANRIKDGKFTLNGVQFSLPINKPPNSLHGGLKGFDKVVWEVTEHKGGENPSITFKYHSCDGEEGYPGDVSVTATYTLTSSTTMRLDMEAVSENKPTPISLAQHTYWNLAGHNSGNVLDHSIQIWASHVTPVDQNTVPTGEIMPVKGTPFDFTSENRIGSSIHEVPGLGYDHNYVLDCVEEKLGLKHAARVKDPSSSRVLNLWTNAPGMQFYTGNYVNGVVGKGGAVYGKHSGLCLETQGFPNAINQPNFPSVVVQPGEKYEHTMLFEFSVE